MLFKSKYNGVDKDIFQIINTWTTANEDWETLEVGHEATSKVCMLILKLLTTKFENMKMREDETVSEFNF